MSPSQVSGPPAILIEISVRMRAAVVLKEGVLSVARSRNHCMPLARLSQIDYGTARLALTAISFVHAPLHLERHDRTLHSWAPVPQPDGGIVTVCLLPISPASHGKSG
jgi:hypothetical protein